MSAHRYRLRFTPAPPLGEGQGMLSIQQWERLVSPVWVKTEQDVQMDDWIHAIKTAAPHLDASLQAARFAWYAAQDDINLFRDVRNAYAAIRDWSVANGHEDAARLCFDLLIEAHDHNLARRADRIDP